MNSAASKHAPLLFFLPFAVTFLDSAFAYFAQPRGIHITANAAAPMLLALIYAHDPASLRLPQTTLAWLALLVVSLCLAVATADNINAHRLLEAGSCAASFYAGYLLFRRAADAHQIALWLTFLTAVYVGVCLTALLGLDPIHFPVTNHYWSQDGLAQARPMVTADSNMQFYYLFPAALTLALPFKLTRMIVALPIVIGGLYVLAQLQTRSGVLAYCGIVLLTLAAPLWKADLGRIKTVLYLLIGCTAIVAFWPHIYRVSELLIYRMGEADMASGNGRLGSTLYAFHNLFDPYWWIPRGAEEFQQRYGGLPHSNLTAMFLDGGLLGLIAWCALVIAPLVQAGRLMQRGLLDAAAVMAATGAAGVLMVQLSLHNPTRDQVWLWAGALVGALARTRANLTANLTADLTRTPLESRTLQHSERPRLRVDAAGVINPRQDRSS